ncbi:Glucoamylase (glucan-1,4-alpha-glucosidase), GH15 family [Amycolatopsis lurida]|uniref:glycoside hydrolase family 15 protein n=1 Tax=Amycolatopsis lurida TaxID=31959 RepID=UPI000555DD73|nr:glycoside hydrolase family 15 protein [Amycolatopsis lurida]SEC77490.1 Glucoamylase (glucan-1,4-alpha-glucosidase), GH15 family [Amycolatopsis lurida]
MNHHQPPIADHGLIGDLQTAALVSTGGAIDWFCCPRFDSPSVFGALLDPRGGHCRIRPVREPYTSRQFYFPGTAVLITRFMTRLGTGEVIDFMRPVTGGRTDGGHRLIRLVRCVRGTVEFAMEVVPRFDYARSPHTTAVTEDGVLFHSEDSALTLHAVREPGDPPPVHAHVIEGGVYGSVILKTGQARGFALESDGGEPRAIRVAEIERTFDDTVRFWRDWLNQSTYRGRWREMVDRSAITLKLLTYAPTGAMVAAPTTSLPEQIGGERNWDYRYAWVRDASLSVSSLLALGFTDEAVAFARWLRERHLSGDGRLKIMYRVDGASDLLEESLAHWSGYRGSVPVRIGNSAADQLQLDVYGELLDTVYQADRRGAEIGHDGWKALTDLLDWLAANWDQPDDGIWETREGKADFTYGRLMSWVAFDRGVRLATAHGLPCALDSWRDERDRVYDQIWEHGWSSLKQAFVQRYGSVSLDASLLRMADVGFITPHDPSWLATLAGIENELVTDSLVYRYDPDASPDGLRGDEGTFSLCTFGYVTALARAGYPEKARLVFEKMLTYANHVGLYAEEIGPNGEQLGNFPQAFTHLGLIDAALTLDRAIG